MASVYIHPEVVETVLPFLQDYLPSAITVDYVIRHPPSDTALVVASYPPSNRPPSTEPWSVAALDLSRPGQTEMWFWSSVEDRGGVEEENGGNAHFRLAYSLLFATLVFLGQRYPDKTAFFIGSLHASFASHIPATALDYLSDNYAKLIFTQSALPIPSIHATEDYVFRTIDVADLGDVVATSSIPRAAAVLGRISNTAAYLASSPAAAAQAWCFTSSEGSMSTLFVRPEKRGSGLGKETMRRELEKGFAERRFISAEVSLRNVRSMAVCAGLGAKKMWEVVWVTVKLDEFR